MSAHDQGIVYLICSRLRPVDVWSDFSLVGYCGDEDPCGSQSGMLGPRGRHSPDFGQYFQLARQIKQLTNYSLSRPVFAAVEDHKLIAGGA
jgi:hypothetical protein